MPRLVPIVLILTALSAHAGAQNPPQAIIDRAIERGCEALLAMQDRNGQFGPGRERGLGIHALACLALLHGGVPPTDPRMARALKALRGETSNTYALAVRLMVIEAVRERTLRNGHFLYESSLARIAVKDLAKLVDHQTRGGGWHYQKSQGFDNSCTQYAVMGLRAADNMGLQVPSETWRRALRHVMSQVNGKGGSGYNGPQGETVSMTAGALSSLVVIRARVGLKVGDRRMLEAQKKIDKVHGWLARRWRAGNRHRNYYTLYGLERAMVFSRSERLGKRDWYREGARWLVSHQLPGGPWPGGPVSTSFAVLFLAKATRATGRETKDGLAVLMEDLTAQSSAKDIEAAVRAVKKKGRAACPFVVPHLSSRIRPVRIAAVTVLRQITGKRFGYLPEHGAERNATAIAKWKAAVKGYR